MKSFFILSMAVASSLIIGCDQSQNSSSTSTSSKPSQTEIFNAIDSLCEDIDERGGGESYVRMKIDSFNRNYNQSIDVDDAVNVINLRYEVSAIMKKGAGLRGCVDKLRRGSVY